MCQFFLISLCNILRLHLCYATSYILNINSCNLIPCSLILYISIYFRELISNLFVSFSLILYTYLYAYAHFNLCALLHNSLWLICYMSSHIKHYITYIEMCVTAWLNLMTMTTQPLIIPLLIICWLPLWGIKPNQYI